MSEKSVFISYLRVIATVFVILLHASTGYLYNYESMGFNWNYSNLIHSATRCSVPIFIMISGALLLPKAEDTMLFYRNRLPKLLYPFVFWTIIYLLYYFYRYTNFQDLSAHQIREITVDKILHGANAHLWYLYMIIGLYLAIPFLAKLMRQLTVREIELFLALWLIAMVIMNKRWTVYTPKFDLTFFSGYMGYLVWGYYLTVKQINWRPMYIWAGYLVVVVFTFWATHQLSAQNNKYDPLFFNYVTPNTAIIASLLFIGIKTWNPSRIPKWMAIIDKYAFGVYLSHIIPLNYIHPILAKHFSTTWLIPLATLSTLLLSIAITFFIRKVPYGKYVSG